LHHLRELTALERLYLAYCKRVTDEGLHLLRELTALNKLELRHCDGVTEAGLASFKRALACRTASILVTAGAAAVSGTAGSLLGAWCGRLSLYCYPISPGHTTSGATESLSAGSVLPSQLAPAVSPDAGS
jgi:hypothetical protein